MIVSNWREVLRHWSLWLGGAGSAFAGWFITAPESAIAAWAMLPADLKAHLPPNIVGMFGVTLFVLALVAKFINQRRLQQARSSANGGA